MPECVKVRVPGTTANCGPGFDALGIACTIYNYLELYWEEKNTAGFTMEVIGEGRGIIPDNERNIVFQAIKAVIDRTGKNNYRGLHVKMINNIPLARGLGSSAAAIIGGLVAANTALGSPLNRAEIFDMATAIEGHPDNVAPALFGGITICAMEGCHAQYLRFIPPQRLSMVVAIPEFTLSTYASRRVLPVKVPFKDATFNISRASLLVGALCMGDFSRLKFALQDRIHQPYRQSLIPGMAEVLEAAGEAGAWGAALSGAGPSIIAFTDDLKTGRVGDAMVEKFYTVGIKARYVVLNIDQEGAVVLP